METKNVITNAMTVDVEEYFHVAALSESVRPTDWSSMPSRVEQSTWTLLDIFEEQSVLATFFVLGWVAERFPDLVRSIAEKGHEIACHGFSHQLVYEQTEKEFREETLRAKKTLEDACGSPVIGYRAASYSITPRSNWALEVLREAGFEYDSSIVPVNHDIYGFPGSPDTPYRISFDGGRDIIEFPPPTISLLGRRIPVGGGGYFRVFPYWFSRWGLNRVNLEKGVPFSFYLHPWEVDPEQPRIKASAKSRFRHYTNLDRCASRLKKLLTEFQFGRMDKIVEEMAPPALSCTALGLSGSDSRR